MPKQDGSEVTENINVEQANGEETSNNSNESEETLNNQSSTENNESSNTEEKQTENKEDDKKEIKDETFETAKDSTGGKFDTLTLVQEVAKLETKLETAKSKTLDENDFYKNISKHLTDDEMQLRFEDDQTNYIQAVNNAKEKWKKENSVDTTEEETALATAQGKLIIAQAIDTILKDPNYKDFNFVKLQDFYHNDLTKKEQQALDKGSTKENLPEYFKKIHDEYKKRNPKNVKNVEAPKIPDASNVSKNSVEDKKEIEQEVNHKKYMEKIGFRKL
ncbi:hypothetical protein PT520_09410 [Aliarcobacter butzleri]|uniref:Scaffolding protein n=1 Tax=Aliarcobacter butzleri TaxID=28197 RepID=A0AAW6VPJ4_9BACT|nr:hypothetical protein [Aliarcobacter butzleri]MDK2062732.1 hypothetical protein [Aliarcobacter butzleri]